MVHNWFEFDIKNERCFRFVSYDGVSEALLSSRKEHLFTGEVLDAWIWEVCATCDMFRDAIYS